MVRDRTKNGFRVRLGLCACEINKLLITVFRLLLVRVSDILNILFIIIIVIIMARIQECEKMRQGLRTAHG